MSLIRLPTQLVERIYDVTASPNPGQRLARVTEVLRLGQQFPCGVQGALLGLVGFLAQGHHLEHVLARWAITYAATRGLVATEDPLIRDILEDELVSILQAGHPPNEVDRSRENHVRLGVVCQAVSRALNAGNYRGLQTVREAVEKSSPGLKLAGDALHRVEARAVAVLATQPILEQTAKLLVAHPADLTFAKLKVPPGMKVDPLQIWGVDDGSAPDFQLERTRFRPGRKLDSELAFAAAIYLMHTIRAQIQTEFPRMREEPNHSLPTVALGLLDQNLETANALVMVPADTDLLRGVPLTSELYIGSGALTGVRMTWAATERLIDEKVPEGQIVGSLNRSRKLFATLADLVLGQIVKVQDQLDPVRPVLGPKLAKFVAGESPFLEPVEEYAARLLVGDDLASGCPMNVNWKMVGFPPVADGINGVASTYRLYTQLLAKASDAGESDAGRSG